MTMNLTEAMKKVNKIKDIESMRELAQQVSYSSNLIEQIQSYKPESEEEEKFLGMVAGIFHCYELAGMAYFGYGCKELYVVQEKFGPWAFYKAELCKASGNFGNESFHGANKCNASGNFDNLSFYCAERCYVNGKLGKEAGRFSKKCKFKGEFGDRSFELSDRIWVQGKLKSESFNIASEILAFVEEAKDFYLPYSGVIITNHNGGFLKPSYPSEAIIFTTNYRGSYKTISIKAEDIPEMDVFKLDFPERFAAVMKKYSVPIPEWLGKKLKK